MKRLPALALGLGLLAGLAALACAEDPPPAAAPDVPPEAAASRVPARPSLLLLVVDTLRADHLGVYGYERSSVKVALGALVDARYHE